MFKSHPKSKSNKSREFQGCVQVRENSNMLRRGLLRLETAAFTLHRQTSSE